MYTFNWALTTFRSESYIGSATALPDKEIGRPLPDHSTVMAARLGPGRAGAFHARRRGEKVRLSKKNSVAERVSSFHDGVVFSAQPIALDTLYSVELLEKDKWSGGLVSVELVWH